MPRKFSENKLKMSVGYGWKRDWPVEGAGPAAGHLHRLVEMSRAAVREVDELAAELSGNVELSDIGRGRKLRDAAVKALKGIKSSKFVDDAIGHYAKRANELSAIIEKEAKIPTDPHTVQIASEVRAHVAGLAKTNPSQARLWLHQNAGNALVASAIMNAPPFLVGLDEDAHHQFRATAQKALHPQEVEELQRLDAMVAAAEQATEAAERMMVEITGMRTSQDGESWVAAGEPDNTARPPLTPKQGEPVQPTEPVLMA